MGMYEFLPHSELMGMLGQSACMDEAWFQSVCSNVLFLIGGFNSEQMNNVKKSLLMKLIFRLITLKF